VNISCSIFIKVYPKDATIVPVDNEGPGCPIKSNDRHVSVVDVMWSTFNSDTAIGDVWAYALNLPQTLSAAVFSDDDYSKYRWCTHSWKFVNSIGYRFNLYVNGTEMIARYRFRTSAMSAAFKVTYYPPDGKELISFT